MKDESSGDFQPIHPNPYIVGNPVRDRSMFFGRESEFEFVRKRFEHTNRGGLLVFCGERRSGKTSILFQILDRRLGPGFIPVLIDMQSMAVGSEIEFLARLCAEIRAALESDTHDVALPTFTEHSNHSGTFQTFVHAVLKAHPDQKLILLFDEYELFENKIDVGLLSQDILHILANLIEHYPVYLVFTGSQHLEQRRHEYWRILGKSLYKRISYLGDEDAVRLVRRPVEGRVDYAPGAVEAILRLTAGQPFYTQAVCQSVVDTLNDRRSPVATPAIVTDVVGAMINNPLPQMIFMWDELERDEKLTLALLAEALDSERDAAEMGALLRLKRRRRYPLDLDRARIATMLEKLFKSEMLLRRDDGGLPRYSFRMDLWRLWVRRQHSVWQVIREEGLPIAPAAPSPARRALIAASALVALAIVGYVGYRLSRSHDPRPIASFGRREASGYLAIHVHPDDAAVFADGRRVGIGSYRDSVAADVEHRIDVQAAGYADTSLRVRIGGGRADSTTVALRPLLGAIRVETYPPGAEVRVDGRPAGRSPVRVAGLSVVHPHRVEAATPGYGSAQQDVTAIADSVRVARLTLQLGKATVLVTSDPAGAAVQRDGANVGTTPVPIELAYGRHRIAVARSGFTAADSTIVAGEQTRQLHFTLAPEAAGVLVVQGDLPASIYIDDALIVENVQNSGPRRMAPGRHAVKVILVQGAIVDTTVTVRSRERATFDFSRGTVASGPVKP